MQETCNIESFAGMGDAFISEKAQAVNKVLKKLSVPFYQVCSSLKDKKQKSKQRVSWRRYSPSCLPGVINARYASEAEVDQYLKKHYGLSLTGFLKSPKRFETRRPISENKQVKKEVEAPKKPEPKRSEPAKPEPKKAAKRQEYARIKIPGYTYTGLGINRKKEYHIYKKQSGLGYRYYYLNRYGKPVSLTKKEAQKWMEKYKEERKSSKANESAKSSSGAKAQSEPVAIQKKEEIKKFARLKPFNSDSKNQEFVLWANDNFKSLKDEYSHHRKFKTLPSGIKDFVSYAFYSFGKRNSRKKPASLPPAQTKKAELKKFAKLKIFKNETKNDEFIAWASHNFASLKREYASARKAKTAPDGTGDFQDFALFKYREFMKAQKEEEMDSSSNPGETHSGGETEQPNDTTQANSNGSDASQDSQDGNEPEANQAKEESDEDDDDDGDLDSLISFIKSNMKKEE